MMALASIIPDALSATAHLPGQASCAKTPSISANLTPAKMAELVPPKLAAIPATATTLAIQVPIATPMSTLASAVLATMAAFAKI